MDKAIGPTINESSHRMWGQRYQLIFATFLQSIFSFLLLAIYSYMGAMPDDLCLIKLDYLPALESNWMGSIGAHIAHYLVFNCCGVNAFLCL